MIFLKIIFWLWLSITVINLLLIFGCSFSVAKFVKQNNKKVQFAKFSLESLISTLRIIIVSALPIFHILFLFIYVFDYDKIYKDSLKKIEKDFEIF